MDINDEMVERAAKAYCLANQVVGPDEFHIRGIRAALAACDPAVGDRKAAEVRRHCAIFEAAARNDYRIRSKSEWEPCWQEPESP